VDLAPSGTVAGGLPSHALQESRAEESLMHALHPFIAALAVAAGPAPFDRTEQREPCAHAERTRQVLFGETHLPTQYSMDAATLAPRNTPAAAYRSAKGERVGLPPFVDSRADKSPEKIDAPGLVSPHPYCFPGEQCQYMATRTIQLPPGRALDFAAI